ncbi:MAG: protein BatD [Elusimicrobia bacterium]|nr:protein BatD [Elusimicrobiota bacterium]
MRALPGILLLVFGAAARAQDFNITASVNQTQITLEEQVVLSVSVSGAGSGLPEPKLPAMPNFNVHGAGQNRNFTFANGVMTNSAEYRYVLVPRFSGRALIGPISAESGGVTRKTAAIEIAVLKHSPAAAPQPSPQPPPQAHGARPQAQPRGPGGAPDLFVSAEVDKESPYVNEQVILTVRFYTGVPLLGNAEWHPPATQGFLSEDIPPAQPRQVFQDGRRYNLSEIKLVLFPMQSGELTIGPSVIVCQAQQEMEVDPFSQDFFQRFFSQGLMQAQTRELRTRSITLKVQPLPEAGRPASFTGVVGQLRVKAETDKKSLSAGDALNLVVTVEGSGNLKALLDPKLPDMPQFRTYDTVSSANIEKDANGVRGSKVFKTVLVPKVSGQLKIPAIPVSYFDPVKRDYATAETRPIEIDAAPGAAQAPAPAYVASPGQGGTITPLIQDIRHIKEPRGFGPGRLAAALSRTLWIHLFPAAVFLAGLLSFLHRESLLQDPAGARFRRALDLAERAISEAREILPCDPQKAAGLLEEALTGFLGDKLNCPRSGLTIKQAQALIKKRFPKMPEGHLRQLKLLWEEIDLYRYAPSAPGGTGDASQFVDGVLQMIKALDEEMAR